MPVILVAVKYILVAKSTFDKFYYYNFLGSDGIGGSLDFTKADDIHYF